MFVFLNPSTLPAPEIIGGKGRRLHSAWPIRVLRNLVWPPSESLRVDELDEVLNGIVAHLTRD